jgi:hypothetical protein
VNLTHDLSRRDALRGLASIAATAAVPAERITPMQTAFPRRGDFHERH